MKYMHTSIPEVLLIEPATFEDSRGWFMESWSLDKFTRMIGFNDTFVQDNHSFSKYKGTLRGLHFQKDPYAQNKLIRCIAGAVFDVAVDLRKGSPYYLQWVGAVLSASNRKQFFIPKGFAHGFVTLKNNVEVAYKVDEYYNPELDRSIRYDSPELGIKWGVNRPILSKKDEEAPRLSECDCNFEYAKSI